MSKRLARQVRHEIDDALHDVARTIKHRSDDVGEDAAEAVANAAQTAREAGAALVDWAGLRIDDARREAANSAKQVVAMARRKVQARPWLTAAVALATVAALAQAFRSARRKA
jgi:ElaB/YqjD/DUF883 family membrane-anchored ribosome-binding protein